jgi:mannosyltransferase
MAIDVPGRRAEAVSARVDVAWWPWALAVIVLLAAGLRFYGLARQGLWYDESRTGWMMRTPLDQVLAGVPRTESTPPLYYVVLWGWVRVFGDTRAGLRSLSAVAGVLTVPFAFAAARSLAGRRVALIAALLVAVNPLLIWYSQEARAYSLHVLLSTVTLWLFARAIEHPSRRRLVVWAIAAVAALWTHYFAAFLVVGEAVLLLRRAPRWTLWLGLGLAAAVAVAPLAVIASDQAHHAGWIPAVPRLVRVEQIATSFVAGFRPPAGRVTVLVSCAIAAVACALALTRRAPAERRGVTVFAWIAGVALAVPLLLSLLGLDYLDGRNVLAAVIPLLVVLACGFAAPRGRPLGLALAAGLTVISLGLVVALWNEPRAQRSNWPALAAALRRLPAPRVVELNGGNRSWAMPLAFELRRTWWLQPGGARVREFDVVQTVPRRRPCGGRTWWGPACNISGPLRAIPRHPGFHRVGRFTAGGFVITRYRAARPMRIEPPRGRRGRHLLVTPRREPVIE